MFKKLIIPIAALSLFASCKDGANNGNMAKGDILKDDIDSTVNPADDFFDYANGGWLKKNEIPASESAWGIAYLVNEELYNRKRKLSEDAAAKKEGGVSKLIGDFWQTAMDTAKMEQQGIAPLKEELAKINAVQTPADVMQEAAHLHSIGANVFFDEGVGQDAKNSEVMSYQLSQGGLGLPNRDYYFNTDARTQKIRAEYPQMIAKMLQATGVDAASAATKATAIVALETRLATASRKLEDLRDPYKNYNKMTTAGLATLSPGIDWNATFTTIGLPKIDTVIIGQPEFYKELSAVIKTTPVQTLKDYMSYQLVNNFAPYLSKDIALVDFNFYGKLLKGAQEQQPTLEACIGR